MRRQMDHECTVDWPGVGWVHPSPKYQREIRSVETFLSVFISKMMLMLRWIDADLSPHWSVHMFSSLSDCPSLGQPTVHLWSICLVAGLPIWSHSCLTVLNLVSPWYTYGRSVSSLIFLYDLIPVCPSPGRSTVHLWSICLLVGLPLCSHSCLTALHLACPWCTYDPSISSLVSSYDILNVRLPYFGSV